jgi:guanosine-diphosphatase
VAGDHGVVHNRHAIVLDAGSTGSRVHVYEFQCCGDKLVMIADELFEEVKPGLSSFEHDPEEAARSLTPLLKRALERVPEFLHSCTPLVLKATAGLRLLPTQVVKDILESVRSWLQTHPFLLAPHHDSERTPVSVMEGSEEAVLAWVTVNFLKKSIGHGAEDIDLEDTSIVMDLGGGSTQIVFAVPDSIKGKKPRFGAADHPEHYYQLHFHGHIHHLYQHSYLGYGLMEARKAIKAHFLKTRWNSKHKFACLPAGYAMDMDGQRIEGDSGGFERCYGVVRGIFDMEKECHMAPCSFNGIHQPAFPKSKSGKPPSIVVFSYFYDRLIPLGLKSPVTLSQIGQAASELCSATSSGTSLFSRLLQKNHEWCLDVVYIYALLAYAYKIDPETPIVVTKQIEGYEAGWALGSALKLLDQHENTCPLPPQHPF